MANKSNEWAKNKFGDDVLGDKRLTDGLINITDSLANTLESSINQACESWLEAKAEYWFFQNENVKEGDILASYVPKTVERAKNRKRIIAIQDTSFISYTSHKKYKRVGGYFEKNERWSI